MSSLNSSSAKATQIYHTHIIALTLRANTHDNRYYKLEDDVPQFSGKINEKFVEWVTDVRVCEAEHKDVTKPRLQPRLDRNGLRGQPKQIIKTFLDQGDLANFTAGSITETLRTRKLRRSKTASTVRR